MKRLPVLISLLLIALAAACTPAATAMPTQVVPTQASAPAVTPELSEVPPAEQMPTAVELPTLTPAAADATATQPAPAGDSSMQTYTNPDFGLSFRFPAGWFGPEEYVSGSSLRVEVGSDVVYPYGTGPDQRAYNLENSYAVVMQYTRNNNNDFWKETYAALEALADGQSSSGARGMLIRVRPVSIGALKGFEYISTLSESAQTEAVYAREVLLVDEQSNLLTIMGSPVNVVVPGGQQWRDVYRAVDEQNLESFHKIVDSIQVE